MRVYSYTCECCGKRVDDYMKADEWIHFDSDSGKTSATMVDRSGRTAGGRIYLSKDGFDWCDLECFTNWYKNETDYDMFH